MDNDKSIQNFVMAALNAEPGVDATHIGVAVDNGIVTLSGHVGSAAEKRAAEQVAASARGVKAIAQEIEVRLPQAKKRSDDEIAERVVKVLAWDERVPADSLQVTVEHGVVTLTGRLDWQYQKLAAEEDVHNLTGVVAVSNQIEVKTSAEPVQVRERIVESFKRMAELDAQQIHIAVEGRQVILSGRVHAAYERALAERAAWSAPGVSEVKDLIAVG